MTNDADIDDELTQIHPLHDALGKLVLACQHLETWIFISLATLSARQDFTLASKENAGPAVRKLRGIAEQLSPDSRDSLLTVLDQADEALELRNAMVHGSWDQATDGRLRAFRPSRSAKSYSEPFLNVEVSRSAMVEAGLRAFDCCGGLQVGLGDWAEELFPDDDA